MANRVNFSVSCTPVVSVGASENVAVDTIAKDMQKSLGGSGEVQSGETSPSVTVDFTTTTGYSSNTVAYQQINTNATTSEIIADASSTDFICIRHTGFEYSTATALSSTSTTMAVDIYVGSQCVGAIRPNEAIVLPLRGKTTAVAIGGRLQSGTTGVALEVFATT